MINFSLQNHNKISLIKILIITGILIAFCLSSCNSEKYTRKLKHIQTGTSEQELIIKVGEPNKTILITCLKYAGGNYVEVNENGIVHDFFINPKDSTVNSTVLKEKSQRKIDKQLKREKIKHLKTSILDVKIGMSRDEIIEILGQPEDTESYKLCYYKKHQIITIKNGIINHINLHAHANMQKLDRVRLNFDSNGIALINITLAFIMFGVALEIRFNQFNEVLKKPKPVFIGFISQFILLPALTFIMIYFIKPTPSVAMGMLLVAACPGGNISNFISALSKGNIALSVTLTAIATIMAIFMTPINFSFWGNLYSQTSDLVIPIEINPWEMVKTVLILLGIPVILGMSFAYKFPNTTKKIVKPIKNLSVLVFIALVIIILSNNFNYFLEYIHLIILIVLAHNALAFLTGYSISSIFRLSKQNRRSITIETGIQNSGLGLVLIFNPRLFDGLGGMAFIAAWWGVWHIISGLGVASYWSRKKIETES